MAMYTHPTRRNSPKHTACNRGQTLANTACYNLKRRACGDAFLTVGVFVFCPSGSVFFLKIRGVFSAMIMIMFHCVYIEDLQVRVNKKSKKEKRANLIDKCGTVIDWAHPSCNDP